MPTKKLAPHFPKVKIAGMPDGWTLLHRGGSLENIPAQQDLEQQRINRETKAVIDARLNILADDLSIPRGEWKALAEAIAVNHVKDFAIEVTSVPSRGRHAKQERFAIVAMVHLCMLDKKIGAKEAIRLLAKERKTVQADALEAKYYKCLGELKGHPAALTRLNMMSDYLPAMLSDPDLRARIKDDLSASENEYFPVRVKK